MPDGFEIPPVPGAGQEATPSLPQGQPYAGTDSGYGDASRPFIPAAQPVPNIYVQVPAQKSSKAPWIVLIVICVLIFATIFGSMYSCSRMATSFTQSNEQATTSGDTVAVIHINTYIYASGSGYLDPETFDAELKAAESDKNVKAIVLRIDSGGGTAASSEEIAEYVADCDKPVVVSVADMCASGAYMVASQADWIYSNEGATVGSIGVIMTTYDATELLDKLGIKVDAITSGEDKGEGSYYQSLTDEQRAALQEQVDTLNEAFIEKVASGRGMDHDTVAALATGRTWTGSQALDLGLIDGIGTYEDSLDKAAELGGITGSYDTVSFDETSSIADLSSLL